MNGLRCRLEHDFATFLTQIFAGLCRKAYVVLLACSNNHDSAAIFVTNLASSLDTMCKVPYFYFERLFLRFSMLPERRMMTSCSYVLPSTVMLPNCVSSIVVFLSFGAVSFTIYPPPIRLCPLKFVSVQACSRHWPGALAGDGNPIARVAPRRRRRKFLHSLSGDRLRSSLKTFIH
jgi:hypothetical protein